jgi:hypothetical protein
MNMPAITPTSLADRRVRLAGVVLAASLALLLVAVGGAIRVDEVTAAAPPATVPDSALRFAAVGAGTDVAAANARDLFTDDRRPPSRRYLMPGDADVPQGGPPPLPTVLGTAIGSDGQHFAIARLPNGASTIVRANAVIGDYTVVSIERGKVVFRGADGVRFTVDASKP